MVARIIAAGLLISLSLSTARAQKVVTACCQPAAPAAATPSEVHTPVLEADDLKQLRLPDVHITSAMLVDGDEDAQPPRRAHLEVDGVIGGTIRFELLLPLEWNGRFVMGGGGGFVGTVQNAARGTVHQGYATVGTDTGHQSQSGLKAKWAHDNLEARVNFGHLAVHRTAEVAKSLIYAFYGQDPEYSYFIGCSRGGGQALMEAQRYPEDFDGIVSAAPAFHWTGFAAAMVHAAQQLYPDPNRLDEALLPLEVLQRLEAEILEKCDALDGVEDGILDDPRECQFDVSQVEWLSEAQRKAIAAIYAGPRAGERQIHPGLPFGGEGHPAGWPLWITGPRQQLLESEGVPNLSFSFGTEVFKYFVFNDPDWNYATYDFANWERDTHLAGTVLNADNPDLSRLRDGGGKMILWHGWSDAALSALASIEYYEEVEKRDPNVREYFRMYLLPGVMHCAGGPGPDQVDWLAAIVDWVENDHAPERLVASKREANGRVGMTRPLYPYPDRAMYTGNGSTNDAANFVLRPRDNEEK